MKTIETGSLIYATGLNIMGSREKEGGGDQNFLLMTQ